MSRKISVGIVGSGVMGRNHARVYSELKNIEKVYVYDVVKERAERISNEYSIIAVESLEALASNCDAVSIAVPTEHHNRVGEYFLSQNIPCLIEKPLAMLEDDCKKLIELAKQKDVILMVGHIERFNPAFSELNRIIKQEKIKIYSLEGQRLSYASSRMGKEIDVIFDLMIHDIDLVMTLLETDMDSIKAFNGASPDPWGHVAALMKNKNDVVVNLTASRIVHNKIRTLSVTTEVGWFFLDFIRQELLLYHGGALKKSSDSKDVLFNLDLMVEKIFIRNQEPLTQELKHFTECVIKGHKPAVSGEQALLAVNIANRIKKTILSDIESRTRELAEESA